MHKRIKDKILKNFKRYHYFIIPTIIFIVISLLNYDRAVWFDESYSYYIVRGDFAQIFNMTALDVHPPLYYFVLKIWTMIFGYNILSARILSIVFSIVAYYFAIKIAERWFGEKTAKVMSYIIIFCPFMMFHAQEMRMYPMVAAIIFAATYVLDLAFEKKTKKYWLIYALLVSIGVWTHYFTILYWIIQFFIILKWLFKNKKYISTIIVMYLTSIILYIPWIFIAIKQIGETSSSFWPKAVDLATPCKYLGEIFLAKEDMKITDPGIIVVLVVIIVSTIIAIRSRNTKYIQLYIYSVIPPVILAILSIILPSSFFVPRYLIASSLTLWMIISLVFSKILIGRHLDILIFGAAIVFIISNAIISIENREGYEDVKNALAEFSTVVKKDEIFLVNAHPTFYYCALAYEDHTNGNDMFINIGLDQYNWGTMRPLFEYGDSVEDFKKKMRGQEVLWYLEQPSFASFEQSDIDKIFEGYTREREIVMGELYAYKYVKSS